MGVFKEDSTRIFTLGPNAEVIYFRRDEEGAVQGSQISGDRGIFRAHGDRLESILFPGEYQGTSYSEALLPSPFELSRFRWVPERQPVKAALLREERVLRRLELVASVQMGMPGSATMSPPALADTSGVDHRPPGHQP